MDAIVCDITALLVWRTPPIARLLAAGPEDDDLLRNIVSPERLRRLREDLTESSQLAAHALGEKARWSHYGEASEPVARAALAMSASTSGPADLLVGSSRERAPSKIVRPRLWSAPLPEDCLSRVAPQLNVVSPELALQQVAARGSLAQTVMLASELCGSFSIYRPPEPLEELIEELIEERCLPPLGGWAPAVDDEGNLSELWSRPPLTTPERLAECAARSGASRGRRRLVEAAELVKPNAASPFEVRAGMLLGFERRRGGEGYGGFEHNERVALTPAAALTARQRTCFCDLFWDVSQPGRRGVDVECQSAAHHASGRSTLSDANRATALQLMEIDVLQLTYAQMAKLPAFTAFSRLLAEKIGEPYREKTDAQVRAQAALRREVLQDWDDLLQP